MTETEKNSIRKKIEAGTIYSEMKYTKWRHRVYKRDGYSCQFPDCKWPKGSLNAHHIKMKWYFPELIFTLVNGITLCEYHHKYVHRHDSNTYIEKLTAIAEKNCKKPKISKKVIKKPKKKASKKKTRGKKKRVVRFKMIKLRSR